MVGQNEVRQLKPNEDERHQNRQAERELHHRRATSVLAQPAERQAAHDLQTFGGGVRTTAAKGSLLTIVFNFTVVMLGNFSTFSVNLNKVG